MYTQSEQKFILENDPKSSDEFVGKQELKSGLLNWKSSKFFQLQRLSCRAEDWSMQPIFVFNRIFSFNDPLQGHAVSERWMVKISFKNNLFVGKIKGDVAFGENFAKMQRWNSDPSVQYDRKFSVQSDPEFWIFWYSSMEKRPQGKECRKSCKDVCQGAS